MRAHGNGKSGFSLVEVLLVLAILGIISTIAIPSYLGQRRRARLIGDAQANAQVLRMALESRKAENGVYGTGGTYTWTDGTPSSSSFLPSFTPKGNSKMNFSLLLGSTGLTYTLTVKDPSAAGATVLTATQTGSMTIAAY
ncbi:MAG: hypothetical protein H6Q00_2168 [Holophagaceae bacterium]|nr:hypothetical protein [Holophagaceae bacterium]